MVSDQGLALLRDGILEAGAAADVMAVAPERPGRVVPEVLRTDARRGTEAVKTFEARAATAARARRPHARAP